MPAYVILGNFTEQGIRNVKNLPELRRAADQWASAHGGRIVANFITFGEFDFVTIIDGLAPDVALEGAFTFGMQGEIRTRTMYAFDVSEAEAVTQRLG
jgi:uncharacterized protein with GYD domain